MYVAKVGKNALQKTIQKLFDNLKSYKYNTRGHYIVKMNTFTFEK